MKNFIYNKWTKAAAVILCLLCIFTVSLTVFDFIKDNPDENVRRAAISDYAVEEEIMSAVDAIYWTYDDEYTLQNSALKRRLDKHFEYFIEYPVYEVKDKTEKKYVKPNEQTEVTEVPEYEDDAEFFVGQAILIEETADNDLKERRIASNTEHRDAEYFIERSGYYAVINSNTIAMSDYIGRDARAEELLDAGYEIYITAKPEYIGAISRTRTTITLYAAVILSLVAAALLLFIYLLAVCGRGADGKLRSLAIDKIFIEFDLAALALSVIGAFAILISIYYDFDSLGIINELVYMMFLFIGLLFTLCAGVFITFSLAVVRNIKCGTFAKRSIIVRFAKFLIKYARKLKDVFAEICVNKTGIALIGAFLLYTLLISVFRNPILLGVIIVCTGFFAAGYIIDILKIKKGIFEIQNGHLRYKITDVEKGAARTVAEAVNNIGEGLSHSVDEQLRAERMKVELITNVSHDLKTPLTSIISYADLMSDMELTPSEANDYVEIIRQKGERLKNLTNDLFEVSKVQSGNEVISREKLDLSLLIRQALGEFDSQAESSKLEFISELSEDAFVLADGRKMSRVFENLLSNILKYSMDGTRVYISCKTNGENVTAELKNISAYPLDFDDEEITGRFVRGDKSRSTEGNGLGLAIAKGYTEACGGRFEIKTDGDLFKAVITFRKETN